MSFRSQVAGSSAVFAGSSAVFAGSSAVFAASDRVGGRLVRGLGRLRPSRSRFPALSGWESARYPPLDEWLASSQRWR
ncbi:hypothetical protein ACFQZ8_32100, partial [Micromonospora azadirachtae]